MAENNNGGPAFPATNYIVPADLEARHVAALGKTQGMTLLDYFAAKANEQDIAAYIFVLNKEGARIWERSREQAKFAYADAMLAARNAT